MGVEQNRAATKPCHDAAWREPSKITAWREPGKIAAWRAQCLRHLAPCPSRKPCIYPAWRAQCLHRLAQIQQNHRLARTRQNRRLARTRQNRRLAQIQQNHRLAGPVFTPLGALPFPQALYFSRLAGSVFIPLGAQMQQSRIQRCSSFLQRRVGGVFVADKNVVVGVRRGEVVEVVRRTGVVGVGEAAFVRQRAPWECGRAAVRLQIHVRADVARLIPRAIFAGKTRHKCELQKL